MNSVLPRFSLILRLCFVGVAAAMLATGCRSRGPEFQSPYRPGSDDMLRAATPQEVYDLLRYRTPDHDLYWTRGRISLRVPEESGVAWFDGTLIYRQPDAVRLRGSRLGIGLLFELIVANDNAWVHLRRERELYGGTLDELRESGGVIGALSLKDMMAAVLVNQDLKERLESPRQWSILDQGREFVMATNIEQGRRVYYRIRRNDGLVRELVLRDAWGRIEAQVIYEGFTLEEGALLPTAMTIHLAERSLEVRFNVAEYKLNPDMDPANVTYLPNLPIQPIQGLMGRDSIIPVDEVEPDWDPTS